MDSKLSAVILTFSSVSGDKLRHNEEQILYYTVLNGIIKVKVKLSLCCSSTTL